MKNSGLNTKDAMARLMGNKKLYQKVLDCFQRDYQDFDEKLVQLLQAGNYAEAAMALHTMKGVSGTLGAESLSELSLHAEVLCKRTAKYDEIQPHLAAFSTELKFILQQIQAGVDLG